MSFFQDVINIVAKYYPQLLSGVGNTMLIALTGTVAGLAIGLLTGIVRTAPYSRNGFVRALHKILNAVIAVYVEIFRGTPMMVQAMVIYWGYAFASGGNTLPLIPSGILIVSVNTGAYMAEIVRGGIISIDKGQFEAGRSLGFNYVQTMAYIVVPQVIKNVLPALANEFISLLKETSVAGYVTVADLTYAGNRIRGVTFSPFMPLIAVALIYLVLVMFFTKLVSLLERRLRNSDH